MSMTLREMILAESPNIKTEILDTYLGFLDKIAEDPFDDTPKLILADWLEENCNVHLGQAWREIGLAGYAPECNENKHWQFKTRPESEMVANPEEFDRHCVSDKYIGYMNWFNGKDGKMTWFLLHDSIQKAFHYLASGIFRFNWERDHPPHPVYQSELQGRFT